MNKNMSLGVSALVIVIVVVGAIYFTSNYKNKMPEENNIQNTQNNTVQNEPVSTTDTANQEGRLTKAGDTVAMNYTGSLENGTVFDSNVDPKFKHVEPFVFNLGAGQVIKGWDQGLVGMKVGEKRHLVIKPEDGYGATGAGNIIPPNATLIFDVELLAIK
ncbi:MAG: FKBP-type peptidyl-prolyl cis-trans isomerase [Candidatus Nomurabacteria bacterium]|nr:FKBP-type peptidyl-prolyl cis-trans isomerase [Candidatus Nomurabacteria bacterium]